MSGTDDEQIFGGVLLFLGMGGNRALIHTLDHRLAADAEERYSRQARGRVPGRDHYTEHPDGLNDPAMDRPRKVAGLLLPASQEHRPGSDTPGGPGGKPAPARRADI